MNKKVALVGIILLVVVIAGYMVLKEPETQPLQDSPPSIDESK